MTVGRRKKSRCRGVLSRPIYTISSFDSRYRYRHYPGGATSIINSALSLATRSNAERFAWTYSTAAPDIIGAYSEQAPLKKWNTHDFGGAAINVYSGSIRRCDPPWRTF